MQLPLLKNHILPLFRCRLTIVYLSSPFPARRCTTIDSHSQATPTTIIRYSRAAFISFEHGICATIIGGPLYLFEEIWYVNALLQNSIAETDNLMREVLQTNKNMDTHIFICHLSLLS